MNNAEDYIPDHLAVIQMTGTGLFHGAYFRNSPTPSGCNRFYLHTSTTEGYATSDEAAKAIEAAYPNMPKVATDD